jgi:hypothetical protein
MRVIAGAILVLAGSVLFAAGAVAQAIQLTVDRNVNFHLAGIEIGMPAGGILGLVGLVVATLGLRERPGSQG